MPEIKHQVLIVGGGFGGVKAALTLAKDQRFSVSLMSDQTNLRYYPTLFKAATGGLRSNSSIPLKVIFENTNVKVINDTAISLDRKAKIIESISAKYPYDSLILALGVVTNYFNIPGLDKYSFSIKTQSEAQRLKDHLHKQLADEHKPDLNYVIVGAGPTGIELAGNLVSYLSKIMRLHKVRPRKVHVDLIEAEAKLLPRLPKDASLAVKRRLKRLGVELYINSKVSGETADSLMVNNKPLQSHSVIWTAGVTNHPFFTSNGFNLNKHGKVDVDVYLQAEDNIYVIGDNANTPYSGLAQTALKDGKFVANNLIRKQSQYKEKAYNPSQTITVIPVGAHWAAVIYGNLRVYGSLGWLIRILADFSGFHSLEGLPKGSKQWLGEFGLEESCPICAKE